MSYYIAAGLPQLVEPSFEYPNRKVSPQPLVKSLNTIRCPNPRIFGEKAYKFRVLEEIIELKKVSVPDNRRLQEGSGQGI